MRITIFDHQALSSKGLSQILGNRETESQHAGTLQMKAIEHHFRYAVLNKVAPLTFALSC